MSEPTYTYIRWDYDNNTAQRLERKGECNGCGKCCKAIIELRAAVQDRDVTRADVVNGGDCVDEEGVWHEITNARGDRRYLKVVEINTAAIADGHVCSALMQQNGKGFCNHHFEKTLICAAWPMAPEHVTPFEGCPYTFEVTEEWQIDEPEGDED